MPSYENRFYKFELDLDHQKWNLFPTDHSNSSLMAVLPKVNYTLAGKQYTLSAAGFSCEPSGMLSLDRIGLCQMFSCSQSAEYGKPTFRFEFALPQDFPLLLVRVGLLNQTDQTILQNQITLFETREIKFSSNPKEKLDFGCYVNGWQSWSYSGAYASNQKAIITNLGPFQATKLFDAATPMLSKAGEYTSDMFGALLDRTHRTGWMAGFLSQVEHFGHLRIKTRPEASVSVYASGDGADILPGSQVLTDWLAISFIQLDDRDPMAAYLDTAARVNEISVRDQIPVGWCSWYHYFNRIKPQVIRNNLYDLSEIRGQLPVDLVQMDDGFEKFVGDWLSPRDYFVGEMDLLAQDIKEEGYTPGLWLAPFIVSPSSRIYKEHPDWMILKPNGKPANAGWNWGRFCTGLDLTHPDAREYVKQVIRNAVETWGYPYLKLDFLYAGALPGKRYDMTLTRAKVLRQAMELVREAAGPQTYLLGCGAPLGSMLGIVDGMRIGTDVAPDWEPKYMGLELLFPNDPDIPSAKNALQNTVSRSFMHMRWWQNDPDCLLLRTSTNLTLAEIQTMASLIFLSGGLLLLSDDMHEVSQYRLKIAQAMLPIVGKRPWVMDWADRLHPRLQRLDFTSAVGDWHLLSYTNWDDKPLLVDINLARYGLSVESAWIVREHWSGQVQLVHDGHFEIRVPTHGTALFSARLFHADLPQYIGGDVHLSQGMEISSWREDRDGISFDMSLNHQSEGGLDVYLPMPPESIYAVDEEVEYSQVADNIYRLNILFDHTTTVNIKFRA